MRQLTFIGIILIALLLPGQSQAQQFRAMIAFPDQHPGTYVQARELIQIPGTSHYGIVGDLKGDAPNYTNYGFFLRANQDGDPTLNRAFSTNSPTATNGIRFAAVTMDTEGRYYLGGASVQNYMGVGRGSERTLTCMDGSGNVQWTVMMPNWSFEALDFHHDQRQVYAASGPDAGTYPADIMISRFGSNGTYLGGSYLQTATEDEAVDLTSDGDAHYYLSGIAAADVSPMLLVAKYDTALNLIWSFALEQSGFELRAADAAWHPAGYLLIAGTAALPAQNEVRGFLAAINPDGTERYFRTYGVDEFEELRLGGVAAVQSVRYPDIEGAMLAGTAKDSGAVASRAVVFAVDTVGKIRWTQGYSDYPPGDIEYADAFSDIIVMDNADDFVAAGQFSSYIYGGDVFRRRLTLVRASLLNGQLDDNGNCLNDLTGYSQGYSLIAVATGSSSTGGGIVGFSYNDQSISTDRTWCTLTPANNPGGGSQNDPVERQFPFPGQLDQFVLGAPQLSPGLMRVPIQSPAPVAHLTYDIVDLQGRRLITEALDPNSGEITVLTNQLPTGMYLLRVRSGATVLAAMKFVPGPFAQ